MYLKLREHIYPRSSKTAEWMTKYIKGKMSHPDYFIYLATVGHDTVGTIAVQLINEDSAYIGDAFVEPLFRRRGIMRQMESRVIEFLKERNVSKVELDVKTNNKEGKRVWAALGYETYKEIMMKKI